MKPFISMLLFTIGTACSSISVVYFANVYDFATRQNIKYGTSFCILVYLVIGLIGVSALIASIYVLIQYLNSGSIKN